MHKPIRYPFGNVARQVHDSVRTSPGRVAADLSCEHHLFRVRSKCGDHAKVVVGMLQVVRSKGNAGAMSLREGEAPGSEISEEEISKPLG